jgi:hypothetical protein
VVRALRWQGEEARLSLSDGSEEALDPRTLTVDAAGVLRCRVRQGRLEARLSNSAAATLSERVEGTDPPCLRVGDERVAVAPQPDPLLGGPRSGQTS